MIKTVHLTKYEAIDGSQHNTPEEALRASLSARIESIHDGWCSGDYDRDRDPVLFVLENLDELRAVLAPELAQIKSAFDDYETALKNRMHGGIAQIKAFESIQAIMEKV